MPLNALLVLQEVGNNRFSLGWVIVKIFHEPTMGENSPWNKIARSYGQYEDCAEVPGHDGKAREGQYFTEILGTGYPSKASSIGNLVARFIGARIGGAQMTKDAVRVNVQGKSNAIDQKPQLKAWIL